MNDISAGISEGLESIPDRFNAWLESVKAGEGPLVKAIGQLFGLAEPEKDKGMLSGLGNIIPTKTISFAPSQTPMVVSQQPSQSEIAPAVTKLDTKSLDFISALRAGGNEVNYAAINSHRDVSQQNNNVVDLTMGTIVNAIATPTPSAQFLAKQHNQIAMS